MFIKKGVSQVRAEKTQVNSISEGTVLQFRDSPHNRQIQLCATVGYMGGVQGSEAEPKADASIMQGQKDQQQDDAVVVGIQWCGG